MEEYIKWLENKIEICLEDKDLQREHWAFCQALKKYRELALHQPPVSGRSEQLFAFLEYCDNAGWIKNVDKKRIIEDYEKANNCA
jgi:hypothetical protein